jgi:hypothetical protein
MTSPTGFTAEEEVAVTSVPQDADLGRVVRVRWTDSGLAMHGWQELRDASTKTVSDVETVGLWMGENDNVVMVAGTRDADNENWLNVQLIWKPSIISKEWL